MTEPATAAGEARVAELRVLGASHAERVRVDHRQPTTAALRHHQPMNYDDLFAPPEPPITCLVCGSHDGVVTITKNDDGSTTWVGHCNRCGEHEEKTVPPDGTD